MTAQPAYTPFEVVVAGGGVAALETALALRALAAERVHVTLVAPEPEFVYRPMTVEEPFAFTHARRYPLSRVAEEADATLVADAFAWVAPDARIAHTRDGAELPYDALVLALGARPAVRFPRARTIDDRRLDDVLHGLVQDVEGGYVRRLAFVMPAEGCWPLPLYELALLTSERAYTMGMELEVTILTPERAPLAAFGPEAAQAVTELLGERGIQLITEAEVQVPDTRHVVIPAIRRTLEVDRVVALPELYGPSIRGLQAGPRGFIPIDAFCRVDGADRVYAAGDATTFPVKHGGVAAQQADVVAHGIGGLAGADVTATPLHPLIRGKLLTGRDPLYISARLAGDRGFHTVVSPEPLWTPEAKIAATYLAPYLQRLDQEATVSRGAGGASGDQTAV